MLSFTDVSRPHDEVFTHIDPHTAKVRHFAVTHMMEYLVTYPQQHDGALAPDVEVLSVNMDQEYLKFVAYKRCIDSVHCMRVLAESGPPVLAVHMEDGTTCQVDGHHRLLAKALRGDRIYKMLRFKLGAWERFLIDLPQEWSDLLVKDTLGEEGK